MGAYYPPRKGFALLVCGEDWGDMKGNFGLHNGAVPAIRVLDRPLVCHPAS